MEADAIGVVHRLIDACTTGDAADLAALFHSEGEITGGPLLGREEFAGGPNAVATATKRADERWERYELEMEVVDHEDSSDQVLVRTFVRARSFGTPLVSEWISWAVITVRDGLVYRVRAFRTEQEGRLAAGLAVAGDSEV
jgi:ketosteroid isomerase-like protein